MTDITKTGADQTADSNGVAPATPRFIGRYRVENLLGQGGFGLVYLAFDAQLERLVAIKVPRRKLLSRPETAKAILTEARIVAGLDHPNLVTVYDFGSTEDCPCFVVSKYIEGSALTRYMNTNQLSLAERVQLVATVADTLQYAHRMGLVHRDIKPGNILIDTSGKPYVADFGIALKEKNFGHGPRFAGTAAYMSPEQARGEGHRVDGRSDIFSLGVVLYELLTGQRPFQAGSQQELLEQITTREIRPPRQWDETIPKELERICFKALSKRASERYSTARDMGDDLRYFLAGYSIQETPTLFLPNNNEAEVAILMPTLPTTQTESRVVRIVPKGLRSFEATDADFFLELLTGPRDREGLPDSIRFWKNRIETRNGEPNFLVGLIYGPSGCGKSSLVKAGLLPQLAKSVTAVYVEANTDETEARLLKGLRRQVADLPSSRGLVESLGVLRQGQFLEPGQKVLLVLDQFEQWLHAKRRENNTELVQALRQCDGDRVQCLVLVRDDFWLAVSRFMQALEIRVLEGENSRLVDLFDLLHARKVLAGFGQAYGRLPDRMRDCTVEQEAFLDQAVAGLAQDGKIIPVRLALFAEMVKGKPWTPATLREVGGTEGIGVTFLEETFAASTASPEHQLHQKAVKAVLNALLPAAGMNIKGTRRDQSDLLDISGYRQDPAAFEALMRILDRETRLLTPIADHADVDSPPSVSTPSLAGEPCYQLTHDYLVPSIREWLVRKQKETRRGRAELRLAERGALWRAKPEKRQLPSLLEWLSIRLLTAPRTWTDAQRQMMHAAARKHLTDVAWLATILILIVCGSLFLRHQWAEESASTRADDLVRRLLDADTAKTPAIIEELAGLRPWTDPRLEKVLADPTTPHERHLHARLALLPVNPAHVGDLRDRMLEAPPNHFVVLREALKPHRAVLANDLWDLLESKQEDPRRRFHAASALAAYDAASQRWQGVEGWVAEQLVAQPALVLPQWGEALRPVKARLVPALVAIQRDRGNPATKSGVVAEVIADYAAEQPDTLAEAIAQAAPNSFSHLFNRLQGHSKQAVTSLTALLERLPADGGAAPNESASQRANLAIALLRLKQEEQLWPLLKQSPDPRARSFLIDRMAALGCDPEVLLTRLDKEPDDTVRAALWLVLGHYHDAALPGARRVALTTKLREAYCKDKSAAVHAAAHWLLGKWGFQRPQAEGGKADKDKQWDVNSLGQTMVRITGPRTFMMGALPEEPGEKDYEKRHQVQIDYSYEIGMTEVTIREFRRFLQEQDRSKKDDTLYLKQADLDPEMPIARVTWYDAAAFCNWLSEREKIPREQWCYQPNEKGDYAEGMKVAAHSRTKRGYRLAAESEWEYACRAGATTMYCYGDAKELLGKYAWYAGNAGGERSVVAKLLPNAFGLFDMHGNVPEWCHDHFENDHRANAGNDLEQVNSWNTRPVRGGGCFSQVSGIRSARRFADRPNLSESGGFRIARRHPDRE